MIYNKSGFEPGCALEELGGVLKNHFSAYGKDIALLNRSHLWSQKQILAYQQERLSDLVKYVLKYVPYYRGLEQIYDFDPIKIKSAGGFGLPFLTHEDIGRHSSELLSEAAFYMPVTKHTLEHPLLGTLPLYRDMGDRAFREALRMRQLKWAGVNPNDRFAFLRGETISGHKSKRGVYWQFGLKKLTMDTGHLTEDNVSEFIAVMERTDIKYLTGCPSRIFRLAVCMQERGIYLPLKAVITTAGSFDDIKRQFIEDVFLCRIFDYYEAKEGVAVIHMCERGRYHIVPEYSFVELLANDDLPTGYYEIAGTSFWNHAMPLIRFRTGDIVKGSDTPCPCGRSFPVVDAVIGNVEKFQNRSGETMPFQTESIKEKGDDIKERMESCKEKVESRIEVELSR